MDCLDLLAVQGTLKSLLQHHSSKASILWPSAFLIVQLSHPYMTTGKTIASTRQTFVNKAMSLLFNMLSRLVITFLSRSKCLLISWLQTPSFPLQLEKNHEINPSMLDEVHFCCSASRAILSSLSKLKRRLDFLYATQEVPRDTLCNSRGTPSFPPQREKSPVFPISSPDEG